MPKNSENPIDLQVTFVDLKEGEQAPRFAVYQLNASGRPARKLGRYDGQSLKLTLGNSKTIALGPDVDDFKELTRESLVNFQVAQKIDLWRKQGVVLPRAYWDRLYLVFACVTGSVRKCRPWFWDLIDDIRLRPMFELAQVARIKPITAELRPHLLFPIHCQPVCDGTVEIYERVCCCHHIHIPDVLDRLRDILDSLPIPIPDPIPDPIPGPDPAPFDPQILRAKARVIQQRTTSLDLSAVPSQTLYEDYLALRTMPVESARQYVLERSYLFPIFCSCSVRKVGETPLQPGGQFDFCYLRVPHYPHHGYCFTTYAYKVKQLINGVVTVVYDGLAAHQYFDANDPAEITTYNPRAQVCDDGPGDTPPNDGEPFVMLEHVGSYGTFHFNFPQQTGVSHTGNLDIDDGTYTTSYAHDCPWGGGLGLRLWFSPELEPIVKYYRLKVFAVDNSGAPVGGPIVLSDSVTWDKLVDVSGDIIRVPEILGPVTVGAENNLFNVPYWSSPNHRYLSGQYHQVWNTAQSIFPDGRYMLVLEVFDGAGNQIKPSNAPNTDPGTAKNFQFRRWTSAVDTDPVLFADAAHIFWIDNTPVGGDIVDFRQDGIPNTGECQFLTQPKVLPPLPPPPPSTFAIGFRAFHIHGVEHAGNGDSNSFMLSYSIIWQRGLNGPIGTLGPALPNNHTDVGEIGPAVSSDTQTFSSMLGGQSKCTFSVTLHVYAKHFTGSGRIQAYDYHETAAFALEI